MKVRVGLGSTNNSGMMEGDCLLRRESSTLLLKDHVLCSWSHVNGGYAKIPNHVLCSWSHVNGGYAKTPGYILGTGTGWSPTVQLLAS